MDNDQWQSQWINPHVWLAHQKATVKKELMYQKYVLAVVGNFPLFSSIALIMIISCKDSYPILRTHNWWDCSHKEKGHCCCHWRWLLLHHHLWWQNLPSQNQSFLYLQLLYKVFTQKEWAIITSSVTNTQTRCQDGQLWILQCRPDTLANMSWEGARAGD